MVNPQRENGHVRIANEILDALARTRIPGEARKCLDLIIRKTYGFNKKEDAISLSQFSHLTGLHRSSVCRAIKKLLEMNLISKNATGLIPKYKLNKNYETWQEVAKVRRGKKATSQICKSGSRKNVNQVVAKVRHTKDNITKDTITKDNTASGDAARFYETSKGRELKGEKLRWFEEFWDAFDLKKGKAEAAEAWLAIKNLNENLAKTIIAAAKKECEARIKLPKGRIPKWPQGWLSGKRWEDEQTETEPHQPRKKSVDQILKERGMAD